MSARDASTELWLLRAGFAAELARRLEAFARTELGLVLCSPGGEEERWAGAFAAARAAPLERSAALAESGAGESTTELAVRAWPPFEDVLERGLARVLAVLPARVLIAVVARALALPPQRVSSLRVDPGRAVLLRAGASGLVLRRSNVLAPDTNAGTALPGGSAGAR